MAEGKELILTSVAGPGGYGYNQIFVAGGTNPIPSKAWDAYVADFGYTKNSTRTAVFGGYEVLSSPGYPTGTLYTIRIRRAIHGYGILKIAWQFIHSIKVSTRI